MLIDSEVVANFEIVIGLVAPIGTDVDALVRHLEASLERVNYTTECIRLSGLLDETPAGAGLPRTSSDPRYYEARMDAGDDLRESLGSSDALAAYAISKIRSNRFKRTGANEQTARHAWILRTIKHPEEVRLLRATYGRRFVLISATASEASRRTSILSGLRDASPENTQLEARVAELMLRDEQDSTTPYGQHVRDAFALGDFFVDLDSAAGPKAELDRLVGLLFGEPFLTPRRDEQGMYLAFAASLRSADPGRQVGAVITTAKGDVLAVGSNEVPRAGGGEYWVGDQPDHRDFQLGSDFNRREVRRALQELLGVLGAEGHLNADLSGLDGRELLDSVVAKSGSSIDSTRIRNLIEFGRIVHAEMATITEAARLGVPILGSTIYTTAFPCHMCMRLIIGSGISRVVYVDPYPKSLAGEMYATEIRLRGDRDDDRVAVESFLGASWRVYPDVFGAVNRKRDASTAKFEAWSRRDARMRLAELDPLNGSEFVEAQVPLALDDRLRRLADTPASVSGLVDDVATDVEPGKEEP
ncbi:anti-phage dCTP deaminase [Actinotalea sp.]|uniref:anti-phage dCTP deaminase n=1 Tax=Actinotalea sp. TaxID=1872145 RepID=UPI002C2A6EFA|nr:anti-phage dCTP deaminase [Actinotalea sp.]HQY34012.1 anti-phage dCTP deaminase [Actinotalea sp.]HRA50205.1 anti-phage dCTP deaminase [Actinotalea sp.]